MEDHDESSQIPRSFGSWGWGGDEFNSTFPNADLMQAHFGLGRTTRGLSPAGNTLGASGNMPGVKQNEAVPRYFPPMENAQAIAILQPHTMEWNRELMRPLDSTAHIEELKEVAPEYITDAEPPVLKTVLGSRSGPDTYEWEKQKPQIYDLYISRRRPLPMVMTEMAKIGFLATEPMYKRKFKYWGWRKNKNVRNYGNPDRRSSTPEPCADRASLMGKYASIGTSYDESLGPSSSCGSTATIGSPPHFNLRLPPSMRQNDLDGYVSSILSHVRSLYTISIDQNKWKIANQCEVQEDIHDDLLVGVANAIRSFKSLGPEFGGMGMLKASKTLEKVVDDCGLFSLPAIWESYLRMIRTGHSKFAEKFLSHALQWSTRKSGHEYNHNPFVQALVSLRKIEKHFPDMIEQVVSCAYRSCIDHVKMKLSPFHLTTLSLWGDFVVYVDNSSANEIKEAVDNFRFAMQKSETDNGSEDDYTLEILGLILYVLQSRDTMAEEAERIALDMRYRVNHRVEAGEKLEGNLLILWKDLRHTLGDFCYARGDLGQAVTYLEEYLSHSVVDERDAYALERLEEWYAKLGKLNEAQKVRQWRISCSRTLLQENDNEPAERDRVDEEADEENGSDSTDDSTYQDEGSDGQTVEEDDTAEIEDAEVELQILQGEIEKLQQRMTILQKKVEKNKSNKTASCMK